MPLTFINKGNYMPLYRKKKPQELRPYIPGEDMDYITIGAKTEPVEGGMIATDPDNEKDQWYITPEFFKENYEEYSPTKSLGNTDQNGCRDNVPDVEIFGEDLFVLLSKASSKAEGWMKSTKAMEVEGGCVVQVTTQQGNNVAEAVTFVPGVKIKSIYRQGKVVSRTLVNF